MDRPAPPEAGAGKSTVSDALEVALGDRAVIVEMDGFQLDDGVPMALGRRGRKGAADTLDVPGYASLLRRLRDASSAISPRVCAGAASTGSPR